MELAAAMIGTISAVLFGGLSPLTLAAAVLGWSLLLLAALDWQHFWLPDRLTFPLAMLGLGANLLAIGPGILDGVIGMLAGFGSLWLIARGFRAQRGYDGMGGGDPKMLGAAGAWLGWVALPQLVLMAALAGLLLALVRAISGHSMDASQRLPLGTLMALAAWPLWLLGRLG